MSMINFTIMARLGDGLIKNAIDSQLKEKLRWLLFTNWRTDPKAINWRTDPKAIKWLTDP